MCLCNVKCNLRSKSCCKRLVSKDGQQSRWQFGPTTQDLCQGEGERKGPLGSLTRPHGSAACRFPWKVSSQRVHSAGPLKTLLKKVPRSRPDTGERMQRDGCRMGDHNATQNNTWLQNKEVVLPEQRCELYEQSTQKSSRPGSGGKSLSLRNILFFSCITVPFWPAW